MKIIPIFFYHEKWAVIMRKFVYSPDGVEKMGPLRGDGNKEESLYVQIKLVEKMGPLRGDGNGKFTIISLRKSVEKMGPLRGDGNKACVCVVDCIKQVEKMGPLRGDGNLLYSSNS